MANVRDERSLGELFGDLARESSALVRQEIALARAELTEKAVAASKDIAYIAAGGAVAYAGLLALIAAVVVILAQLGVAWWLSTLIVGVVVTAIGAVLIQKGMNALRNMSYEPKQTVESLRENAQWAKEQVR